MTLTSKEKLTEILIYLKEIERLAPGTFTFFLHDIAEEDIPKAGFSVYKPNEEADYKVADLKNSTNHISFFTARERHD